MPKVQYEVVEHDDGWAYKVEEAFSETFPSQTDALAAARIAAANHRIPGVDEHIEFQDPEGRWHIQIASGLDRPQTEVVDAPHEEFLLRRGEGGGPLKTFLLATSAALAVAYILRHLQHR